MRKDCILVCSRAHPTQVENAKFNAVPYIKATWKGRAPFRLWAMGLVTRLLPPGKNGETTLGVAVCLFSKWVEFWETGPILCTVLLGWPERLFLNLILGCFLNLIFRTSFFHR